MVYRIINIVFRAPSLSLADFRDHYEKIHAPLVVECTKPRDAPLSYTRRYAVYTNTRPEGIATPPFDCIAELAFADEATWKRFLAGLTTGENGKRIAADSELFQLAPQAQLIAVEMEDTIN